MKALDYRFKHALLKMPVVNMSLNKKRFRTLFETHSPQLSGPTPWSLETSFMDGPSALIQHISRYCT